MEGREYEILTAWDYSMANEAMRPDGSNPAHTSIFGPISLKFSSLLQNCEVLIAIVYCIIRKMMEPCLGLVSKCCCFRCSEMKVIWLSIKNPVVLVSSPVHKMS